MSNEYKAEGSQVLYFHPINGTKELIITVHPTEGTSLSEVQRQAYAIAEILNKYGE